MKNKVLVIGADHHNTLGIVESLGQKAQLLCAYSWRKYKQLCT